MNLIMWWPKDLKEMKDVADIVRALLTSVAVVIGGAAAYWKWFRGRTFRPRIEVSIEACFAGNQTGGYATITCKARNLGLIGVPIDRAGSVLRIYAARRLSASDKISRVHWVDAPVDAAEVFVNHSWIEPGEPIIDRHVYLISEQPAPLYRCQLIVARTPSHRWKKSRVSWTQHTFLNAQPSEADTTRNDTPPLPN